MKDRHHPSSPFLSWPVQAAVIFWMLAAGLGASNFAAPIFPGEKWAAASPASAGLDEEKLKEARDYALTGGGSGYITRGGQLVLAWGDPKKLYDLKSTTKSFGAAALGLALKDGKMELGDRAARHHPALGLPPESNERTGWLGKITIRHLVSQTAGFEKPGGYTPLLFEPGTKWDYSDSGPNWLAEIITLVYREDLNEFMFRRLFSPIGIERSDLRWRQNAYRPHQLEGIERREFGSGIHANVDAMARLGYLHLRGGQWKDMDILPADYVEQTGRPAPGSPGLEVLKPADYSNASDHYGYLWWNNADGTLQKVPRDAYWSWGLHDSLILVLPSLDIVVSRAGQSWKRREGAHHYEVLKPFFEPIAASVQPGSISQAPYPKSSVIRQVEWAPAETIVRQAQGSDNWPLTWADDDHQYTAYGDGHGFEPRLPFKLSLGLARVEGAPADFQGINLRSSSAEDQGDGARGRKASGMLMVDGILHMWVRNAGNSQLGWSADRGLHWSWAEWKFGTSFGCPTFLNFGRNYEGARDDYVYVYSQDSESAYERADRFVLARVKTSQVRERSAYEFFAELSPEGEPRWTREMERRGAVFVHPQSCYRSAVSYNAGLKRYLWCQTGLGEDTRFRGGFAIYDAPEPWGPWTTVFFTREWDVGPGETCSLPTKWMSPDGRTAHLVFSGNDCFSVRKVTFELAR